MFDGKGRKKKGGKGKKMIINLYLIYQEKYRKINIIKISQKINIIFILNMLFIFFFFYNSWITI